jgi:undecaprenyl-diphosphatase
MSAGLFAGPDARDAARHSFSDRPRRSPAWRSTRVKPSRRRSRVAAAAGVVASFVAGVLAIAVLLRYLRTNSFTVFVVYRIVLAFVVLVVFLSR